MKPIHNVTAYELFIDMKSWTRPAPLNRHFNFECGIGCGLQANYIINGADEDNLYHL